MLVLTRKAGEAIAIGEDIRIVVMQVKGKQVRLGIKAPSDTAVHREEIYQKIQQENRRASLTRVGDLDRVSNFMEDGADQKHPHSPVVRRVKKKPEE